MAPPHLSEPELLLRLALAALLGAVIGLEREWRDRTAGLRTHMLVCVGSTAFTIVSAYGFSEWYVPVHDGIRPSIVNDPTRIAAQIVTGIGFLGAGAIFRSDDGVRGLTTAATLWVMAAIGLSVGAGYYTLAVFSTALILLVLVALRQVSRRVNRARRSAATPVEVEVSHVSAVGVVLERIAAHGGVVSDFTSRADDANTPTRRLEFGLTVPNADSVGELLGQLAMLDTVRSISAHDVPLPPPDSGGHED